MKHQETFLSGPRQSKLFYQIWQPEKEPRAVILLIHGLGEHSGRYGSHFASFYTKAGIAILAPDLPGHGKTKGIRGHISKAEDFFDILDMLLEKTKALFPAKPIFLYGHSMGGEIVLWYTLDRHPSVKGVFVTSPSIDTKEPIPPFKLFLASLLNTLWPSFTMDNGLEVTQLSRDKQVVDAYVSDPLVHKKVSARLGWMISQRGAWILSHAQQNTNTMLVMIGSNEGIVSKEAVDAFCKSAPKIDYKIWPKLYHEIHNEPEKQEVFKFSLAWLEKQLKIA